MVKIERVDDKKAKKLQKRGYATLADFKPLFRNLKTGLQDPWIGLSARELKAFKFAPLPAGIASIPGPPSLVGGVILVSNGSKHGMIFTEISGAGIRNEPVARSSVTAGMVGTIRADEPGQTVQVLDIEGALSRM